MAESPDCRQTRRAGAIGVDCLGGCEMPHLPGRAVGAIDHNIRPVPVEIGAVDADSFGEIIVGAAATCPLPAARSPAGWNYAGVTFSAHGPFGPRPSV
jgi:hypothetical protein